MAVLLELKLIFLHQYTLSIIHTEAILDKNLDLSNSYTVNILTSIIFILNNIWKNILKFKRQLSIKSAKP
jgi:hypothetical protein